MTDLRKSLFAKITAILLLAAAVTGAVLGVIGNFAVGAGYGTAASYREDNLCLEPMESAMYTALWYTVEDNPGYYGNRLSRDYQGFSAVIYDGPAEDGVILGRWDTKPTVAAVQHTMTVAYDKASAIERGIFSGLTGDNGALYEPAGYYTVVGWLAPHPPQNSEFALAATVYGILHPLVGSTIVLITFLSVIVSALLLVFLLCAAGHRKCSDHITPGLQDRIPLDLYICIAGGIFVCLLWAAAVSADALYSLSNALFALSAAYLCLLGCGLVAVAFLMTLATRLKLGKWWRNTLCWIIVYKCWRLISCLWRKLRGLFRAIPFIWRSALAVCLVLLLQTSLTYLSLASYNGGLFILVMLAIDIAILIAAAWFVRQLQLVKNTGKALASGNLDAKADTANMYFDVKEHAEHLNAIGLGMTRAVEQRIKSERLKTELITNVSHDIKTPLTSIINYVDLLQAEELPETAREYVSVLDRQSRRLKKLTEDLVEASKASTGNVAVSLEPIIVNEIIHQAIGDYDDKLTAGRLEVIVSTYEGNVVALADGRLLWRVLDNLLSNVCKYALAGTRVYVDLISRENTIVLSVKNISRDPIVVNAEDLTERFVRGDASRHTEGSGLGLNIAQSLMELMGGTFSVSTDGDLFKAELTLQTIK